MLRSTWSRRDRLSCRSPRDNFVTHKTRRSPLINCKLIASRSYNAPLPSFVSMLSSGAMIPSSPRTLCSNFKLSATTCVCCETSSSLKYNECITSLARRLRRRALVSAHRKAVMSSKNYFSDSRPIISTRWMRGISSSHRCEISSSKRRTRRERRISVTKGSCLS